MRKAAAERLCAEVLAAVMVVAPEVEVEGRGLRVLTRYGWMRFSAAPSTCGTSNYDKLAIHCCFETPHLAAKHVYGVNTHTGKWNSYVPVETAVATVLKQLSNHWPTAAELPLAQFRGAVAWLVSLRRKWLWSQPGAIFDPQQRRVVRLRVLGQPGSYNSAGSVWFQAGQTPFATQDAWCFEAVAAEFSDGYQQHTQSP